MIAQRVIRRDVAIPVENVKLEGELTVPESAKGLVLFAHGSGSSRHSARNKYVAGVIRNAGLGTLLFDLLTSEEEAYDVRTGHLRFDIRLLAKRLAVATEWLCGQEGLQGLSIGYFGSSTGGGAALVAAAELGDQVAAVVSRGGRPDLAAEALRNVRSPVLLIVGGLDDVVIGLNEEAYMHLRCQKELTIVPGATHLFEEPGKLDQVARLAAAWFARWLK